MITAMVKSVQIMAAHQIKGLVRRSGPKTGFGICMSSNLNSLSNDPSTQHS